MSSSISSYPSSDSAYATSTSTTSSVAAESTHTPRASSSAEKPRILICLLRLDLRMNDNALFHFAHLTAPPPQTHHHQQHFTIAGKSDLDALYSQAEHLVPLYVFDERSIDLSGLPDYTTTKESQARTAHYSFMRTGLAPARFICESVYDLQSRLRQVGSDLMVRFGLPEDVTVNLVKALHADGYEVEAVWTQKEMSHDEASIESKIAAKLKPTEIPLRFVHGKTLVNTADLPHAVKDTPDIFTPFRKSVEALGANMVRSCYKVPQRFKPVPPRFPVTLGYSMDGRSFPEVLRYLLAPITSERNTPDATLQQRHPASTVPFRGGETSALERLEWYFLRGKSGVSSLPPVSTYKQTRNNLIGHAYSTKMSPFLAFGCISPRQIWEALNAHDAKFGGEDKNTYWVRFELLWRDYFFWASEKFGPLLFELGGFEMTTCPSQAQAKTQPGWWKTWDPNTAGREHPVSRLLEARTGIPFIDANVLELRETGFMSNRGRQNVASFLTKDLGFDWLIGAEFFQSYLIDYDATSNYGNWQYVAGVGNDPRASRQFNIIKQAKDFDSHGEYVKLWLPALSSLPPAAAHTPWLLSEEERRVYGLKSTVMDVEFDAYPAQPMFENEAWHKHYARKEGVGSKMFGNPQERVKDREVKRGAKHPLAPKTLPRLAAHAGAPSFRPVSREMSATLPSLPSFGSGASAPAPRPIPRSLGLPRPPTAFARRSVGAPAGGVPMARTSGLVPPQPSQGTRTPTQQTSRTAGHSFSETQQQPEKDQPEAGQLEWRRGGAPPAP